MSLARPAGRLRAYLEFVATVVYFFLARELARRAALGLVREEWQPLIGQAVLVFLLLAGYAFMVTAFDRQPHPVSAQGLPRRDGWHAEAGLGLATGWALALVCVLPMTLVGGIAIVLNTQPSAWGWLLAEAAFFALAALAEELIFRGYGFQRFAVAVGPIGAALGYAAFYAILQSMVPGASHASLAVSLVFSILLSTAYLRTRALWLSWGINFGWKASRALLFGLTIAGVDSHSPVVQGNPMGPFWLTGGGYGLDGSWFTFVVLVAALPVLLRLTRDLDFRWNAPVLIPGGIPVDLDAAARQQH
ncbi:MAG: CPBP family glutamic-type intramembrane protease, partial [Terracidiphilus sp.]